jgi:hypothetical protein
MVFMGVFLFKSWRLDKDTTRRRAFLLVHDRLTVKRGDAAVGWGLCYHPIWAILRD